MKEFNFIFKGNIFFGVGSRNNIKELLIENNYMISRPFYKGKYYLRVVFGNFNTTTLHISELTNLINNFNEWIDQN